MRFGPEALVTVGTSLFIAGVNLFTGVLSARIFGPEARGELAAIQLWGLFFALLAQVGIPASLIYYASREPAKAGRLYTSSLLLTLLAGAPVLVLSLLIIPVLLTNQRAEIIDTARLYLLGSVFGIGLQSFTQSAFRSYGRVVAFNLSLLAAPLGWLAILLLNAFSDSPDPIAVSIQLILVQSITGIGTLLAGLRILPRPFGIDTSTWRPMLLYGLPLVLAQVPAQLAQSGRLGQVFIAAFLDPTSLGLFVVGYSWAGMLTIVPVAISLMIAPRVAGASTQEAQLREFARGTRLVSTFLALAVPTMLVVSPLGVPLLFGREFGPATGLAMLLVVATALSQLRGIVVRGLRGMGKTRFEMWCELVGVVLSILLIPLGITLWSMEGAGVGVIVAELVATTLALILAGRVFGAGVGYLLLPTRADFDMVLAILRQRFIPLGRKV